jgi:hypothetical protein
MKVGCSSCSYVETKLCRCITGRAGIHGAIWEEITGQEYSPAADRPLTLAAYESGLNVRAYVVHAAVGDMLADMPLFLQPGKAVQVPVEATYQAAFTGVPRRWQRVLEAATG